MRLLVSTNVRHLTPPPIASWTDGLLRVLSPLSKVSLTFGVGIAREQGKSTEVSSPLEFPGAGRWHLDATAANVRPVDARTDVDSDAGPRRPTRRTALGPSESAARRARPAGAA